MISGCHSNFGQRAWTAGVHVLTAVLTFAVPPQAANAVLYLSTDVTSAYDGVWKGLHSWVSDRVLRRVR
jgi:hypothetical protein